MYSSLPSEEAFTPVSGCQRVLQGGTFTGPGADQKCRPRLAVLNRFDGGRKVQEAPNEHRLSAGAGA